MRPHAVVALLLVASCAGATPAPDSAGASPLLSSLGDDEGSPLAIHRFTRPDDERHALLRTDGEERVAWLRVDGEVLRLHLVAARSTAVPHYLRARVGQRFRRSFAAPGLTAEVAYRTTRVDRADDCIVTGYEVVLKVTEKTRRQALVLVNQRGC